ncbi:MAG TPA: glycosyltransferase [Terriglobales bacterium]
MAAFLFIGGVLSATAWLYLLFANGSFWRVRGLTLPVPRNTAQSARVVVVIPARNEAETIGRTIKSLLEQQYCGELNVVLVDDNSTDGTADVALRALSQVGCAEGAARKPTSATRGQMWGTKERSLAIIKGRPLPAVWSGKMWAVHQGVEEALKLAPDYLLLTDADIVHEPTSVASLVAKAASGFDIVSLMVRLHCRSVAERLLIPAFVFFFFMLYPPRWIADPRRKTAGAAGGCILIHPEALARAGGISAIRSEIIDDCALAREVKRSGGRVWLGLADETASVRPYNTFAEIGRMIARTAFNQLGHSTLMLVGALVGLTLVYLLPIALLFTQQLSTRILGALAWLLMALCYSQMVRFYRLSPVWALALPLSAAFYMGATVVSAIHYWSGRGGQWKGRAQDVQG